MHTPKVLSVFAAFFVFILNTAYGGSLSGRVEDDIVFSLIVTNDGNIKVISEYTPPNVSNSEPPAPSPDSRSEEEQPATEEEPGNEEKEVPDTEKEASDQVVNAPQEGEEPSEGSSDEITTEAQKEELLANEATDQTGAEPQGTPSVINDIDQVLLSFYGNLENLTLRPVPDADGWFSVVDEENPSSNPVYLSIADSQGDQNGSDSENSGESFFSRVSSFLREDNHSENNNAAAQALATVLLTPAIIQQVQNMMAQAAVQSYSLRRTRIGTTIHSCLGRCFNSYSGLAVTTVEVRVPRPGQGYTHSHEAFSHSVSESGDGTQIVYSSSQGTGNYNTMNVTIVIPYSYDAHALGVTTAYCSDGKECASKKKDKEDDDGNPDGKAPGEGLLRRTYNYASTLLSRMAGKGNKSNQQETSSNTGKEKQSSMHPVNSVLDLHNSLTGNHYDTSYPNTEELTLLTLKHEIKANNLLNKAARAHSAVGLNSGLNPANQAKPGIMGF
ncbi:hypothetical protein [Endozoicomonas lisbonensis]|uniref:Uncharacterized protein n=1 Tax=Endozoicomonas lisbonensis TaxID=3120522 RepID=A0ABV2SDV9_9GAMM